MPKLADIVDFRRDLFFDGAVQISWFETDPEKRDLCASHFVFHGPTYHGVAESDIDKVEDFPLTDTASFASEIISRLDPNSDNNYPVALAIAGWGTGKSHLGLTLATLLARTDSSTSSNVLQNLTTVDNRAGQKVKLTIENWQYPSLLLPINGMDNFDLSAELTRQVLTQLKKHNLDTAPVEDLSPRFQIASSFTQRNYELRTAEFQSRFGAVTAATITENLNNHDETAYKKVNEIFELANGYPIRASGQESPRQLIQTLCEHYCGDNGPFQNVLVLFDEFGRYLEFAVEKPHIAGEAAIQQLFEGVQDHTDKCLLLCFIQYELKAYKSRVSHEKRDSLNRFIGRYDAARKYYLSTNLETLFANLITKKSSDFFAQYTTAPEIQIENRQIHRCIQKWFTSAQSHAVWYDVALFEKVVCQGCWPLHPLATWFLCKLASDGQELQQRSAITFIDEVYTRFKNTTLPKDGASFTIPAVELCLGTLLDDLASAEETGHRGALVHSYLAAVRRYQNDLSAEERVTLLAVLIAGKTGLKISGREEAHQALAMIAGSAHPQIEDAITELQNNYNVLEWNERFNRYEIIGDAVPRTEFLAFLRRKTQGIKTSQVEEIFALNIKNWAELKEVEPNFRTRHNISTTEWIFNVTATSYRYVQQSMLNAIKDWQDAIKTDQPRGQLLYCYIPPDVTVAEAEEYAAASLKKVLRKTRVSFPIPILIVLISDTEAKLKRALAEYWVLTSNMAEEEEQKFSNFIRNQSSQLQSEIKLILEAQIKAQCYIIPEGYDLQHQRIQKMADQLFEYAYPKAISFPFDGFNTSKGNAAKDCKAITEELFKGTLDYETWIATRNVKMKNRAVILLKAAWNALTSEGKVSPLPANSGVQEVIQALKKQFESPAGLNLGAALETLIKPPIGCNIASAGLLMGVFIAPRINILVMTYQQQEISPAIWLGKAFSGSYFNLPVLQETVIRVIPDDDQKAWEKHFLDWDSEKTWIGQIRAMLDANDLRRRIPIPGYLQDRWIRLSEAAEVAKDKLEEFISFKDAQDGHYENAVKFKNVNKLSYIGFLIHQRLEAMRNEMERWTNEQIQELEPRLDRVRQMLVHLFDEWLSFQTITKSHQFGDFRHKMENQCGKNLKALNLMKQHQQLTEHVLKTITNIEKLEKISFIIDETSAFLNSHRATSDSSILELDNWIVRCKELRGSLLDAQRVHKVSDISTLLKKLEDFKTASQIVKKQHRKQVGDLLNLLIITPEDVRSIQAQVSNLTKIFQGQEIDLEDLHAMDMQLGQLDRDMRAWNDMSLSNRELTQMVEARIKQIEEASEHDEEPPPWNTPTVYRAYLQYLLEDRHKRADEWMNSIGHYDVANTCKMSADDCQALLSRIRRLPAYLSDNHLQQLQAMQMHLNQRLDDLKVDGLLARFKQLSRQLQQKFLKLAADVRNM